MTTNPAPRAAETAARSSLPHVLWAKFDSNGLPTDVTSERVLPEHQQCVVLPAAEFLQFYQSLELAKSLLVAMRAMTEMHEAFTERAAKKGAGKLGASWAKVIAKHNEATVALEATRS